MNSTAILNLKLTALLALSLLGHLAQSQTLQLQPLAGFGTNGNGSILPGERPYLTDGSTNSGGRHELQRSMGYNPATGHLLMLSRTNLDTGESYYVGILDGATGADVGALSLGFPGTGSDGGFDFTSIAVGDDGAIYVCNLSTKTDSTGRFNLYHYASESSPQDFVYSGDPSNGNTNGSGNYRWGDTLAVTGTGASTKVLVSSRGTLVAILTPAGADLSQPWSATTLQTDVPAGDLGYGLAFGAGNTFWVKAASPGGNPLYQLSYNTVAGTATTLNKYSTTVFPGWTGALGVQAASNLLAGLEMAPGAEGRVRLYDISNAANPPVLLDRKAWVTNEAGNGVFAGSVVFAGAKLYAFDSDNGIMAFSVVSGPAPSLAPLIIQNPANATAPLSGISPPFTAAADGLPAPGYQWYSGISTLIANATNSAYAVTNIVPANFTTYYLVAANSFGSVTSAPAALTEAIAFKNGVIYEPFNYAVGLPLQGMGGWVTNTVTTAQGYILPGSMNVPDLSGPLGNHYSWSNNITVRLPFGTITNGPLYFSFALRVSQLGSNTGEDSMGGLAYYTGTSLYPKICVFPQSPTTYRIGIGKGSGLGANSGTNATVFTTDDIVFVVARLTVNTNTTSDDTVDLWVNPDPATFGAASPPAASVPNINGKADGLVDRFSWRGITTGIQHEVDELRIGFTWAAVTPPPPVSLAVRTGEAGVVVSWPATATGWTLLGATGLVDAAWETKGPIVVQGGSNTFTVPAPTGQQFFRLTR